MNKLKRANSMKQELNFYWMGHLMHLPKEKRSHVQGYSHYKTERVTQRLQLYSPDFSPLTVVELIHGLSPSTYRENFLAHSRPALQILLLELLETASSTSNLI